MTTEQMQIFTAAQARRAARNGALGVAEISAAFDAMTPDAAYVLACQEMTRALARRQADAHARPVDGVPV